MLKSKDFNNLIDRYNIDIDHIKTGQESLTPMFLMMNHLLSENEKRKNEIDMMEDGRMISARENNKLEEK